MPAGIRRRDIGHIQHLRLFLHLLIIFGLIMAAGCSSSSDTTSAVQQSKSNSNLSVTAQIVSPGGNISIPPGSKVSFKGLGTGGSGSYNYSWSIPNGDKTSSFDQELPDVTFASEGTNTVILTVTDTKGLTDTDTVVITVTATLKPLTAKITSPASNFSTTAGTTINLAGIGSGGSGTYTYAWNIPGGSVTSSTAQSLTVSFAKNGSYLITFTVADSTGTTKEATVTITVGASA